MTENSIKALAEIAANPPNSDRFVAWATLMLVEGHDSYHLRILAGMDRMSSFETEWTFEQCLKELGRWPFDTQAALQAWHTQLLLELATGVTVAYRLDGGTVTVSEELWVLHWAVEELYWEACAFDEEFWPPGTFDDRARLAVLVRDRCQEVRELAVDILKTRLVTGPQSEAAAG